MNDKRQARSPRSQSYRGWWAWFWFLLYAQNFIPVTAWAITGELDLENWPYLQSEFGTLMVLQGLIFFVVFWSVGPVACVVFRMLVRRKCERQRSRSQEDSSDP